MYLMTSTPYPHMPLKFFEWVKFRKLYPLLPKIIPTNSDRSSLFADPYAPLQSVKSVQKFEHYILCKLASNIANVVTTAVRKRVWNLHKVCLWFVFSERELMFMFAICRRPSVCRLSSVVCLSSVCHLSVTFVHPTQPIEIFGNVSAPCNTLVTWRHPGKILRRSSQGNPSVGGLNQRVLEKM